MKLADPTQLSDMKCCDCGKVATILVELGEEPGFTSCTTYVCRGCLVRALELVPHE